MTPNFTIDFPQAVVRERTDELTLRREEESMLRTFIDTTNVGDNRWEPQLLHEDWYAICQVFFPRCRAEDPSKMPSKVASPGHPPEEPDDSSARRAGAHNKNVGPALFPESEAFRSYCLLAAASCTMCDLRMHEVVSSDGEEGEHNVRTCSYVVAQDSLGMFEESSFKTRNLLAVDLLCQEMQTAWLSEICRKVGNDVLG